MLPYEQDMTEAKKHFETGNYRQAYEYLRGNKIKEDDVELYTKNLILMKLERHYESYLNYNKMGHNIEALNALVQGVQTMDKFETYADQYGVRNQFDEIGAKIINALANSYSVTPDTAREWLKQEGTEEYVHALRDWLYMGGMSNEMSAGMTIEDTNPILEAEENEL